MKRDATLAAGAFRPDQYAALASIEPGNFWFESRNRLILWALARHFPSAQSFLEVGCGTGFVLQALSRAFPSMELAGSDVGEAGLAHARARVPRAEIFRADAASIRASRSYDVVGAFDVLEHIPDDEAALAAIARIVSPGGGLLVTVPQHPWLWSPADEHAGHVRRYRRRELVSRVRAAGFTVLRVTSFVSMLFPLMVALRARQRRVGFTSVASMAMPAPVNAAFTSVLTAERATIRAGATWPFGGSLLLVARRGSSS